MRKSNYEKALEMAFRYGDKRVKRFSDMIVDALEDKAYHKEEIMNLIASALLIDSLKSLTEQQSDTLPSSPEDMLS